MKLKYKLALECSENLLPGSSVEDSEAYKKAWEVRAAYLEGFEEAKKLTADSLWRELNPSSTFNVWSVGEEETEQ
jgi:hypothetical protein